MGVCMFKIERLAKHHDRASFDCGDDALNVYLRQYANQHSKKGLSKTYILTNTQNPNKVLGYFTLTAGGFRQELTGYPNALDVPCVLIGRLAVDISTKGQGLGGYLVTNALQIIKQLSQEVGIAVVLVELKGKHLIAFYKQFGFVAVDELTMYLRLSDL